MPRLFEDSEGFVGLYTADGNELDEKASGFFREVVERYCSMGYSPVEIRLVLQDALHDEIKRAILKHNRPRHKLMKFGRSEEDDRS